MQKADLIAHLGHSPQGKILSCSGYTDSGELVSMSLWRDVPAGKRNDKVSVPLPKD